MKITNKSSATRIINVKRDNRIRQVAIEPGQTVDETPVETPVYKSMLDSGVLVKGTVKTEPTDEEKAAAEAEAQAQAEAKAKAEAADKTKQQAPAPATNK